MLRAIIILGMLSSMACNLGNKAKEPSAQTFKECAEIKVQSDCTKDKISGKSCAWMGNLCVEETAELEAFMSEDKVFVFNSRTAGSSKGLDTKRTADWNVICGIGEQTVKAQMNIVQNIKLTFAKGSDQLKMEVICYGASARTFNFKYSANKVDSADEQEKGNLLLKIDLNGEQAQGNWNGSDNNGNLLEFFSKSDWIYRKSNSMIAAINQLGNNGYQYPTIALSKLKDFVDAFQFQAEPQREDQPSREEEFTDEKGEHRRHSQEEDEDEEAERPRDEQERGRQPHNPWNLNYIAKDVPGIIFIFPTEEAARARGEEEEGSQPAHSEE
jgi:hypothetical protein